MKKRIILVACVVLALVAIGCLSKPLIARFYNKSYEITEQQIENRIAINEINNSIYKDYISKVFADEDLEEQYALVCKSTDREGVIAELKKAKYIESVLKKENKYISFEDAKKTAQKEFERAKTDETQENYYESLEKVLDAQNITEQKYLELTYDYARDLYNESAFNRWFVESKYYKDNRDPDLQYADEYFDKEEQIEAFLEKELKKIKVVIK